MRCLLAFAVVCAALPAMAQDGRVLLRWNVPADSALAFRLAATNVDPDSTPEPSGLWGQMPTVEQADMTAVLRPLGGGRLEVEFHRGDVVFAEGDSTAALFEKLQGLAESFGEALGMSSILRGEIDEAGTIGSFWLPQEQKNLLALYFELPEDSVAVGDTWRLDGAQLLTMRNVRVDEGARTNVVRLVAIEGPPDRPLAVMEYDLHERVEGGFGHMTFAYRGQGTFDVVAGTWLGFAGRMDSESTFMGQQVSAQQIVLEPVAHPDATGE